MTITSKVLVQGKYIESAQAPQYTSTGCKTIVDKVTVTNVGAGPASFSANLVPNGGAAGPTNLVADDVTIAEGSTYLCPEIAGARLDAGDLISMVASAASALVLRIDGRQVTTA